ncbi:negative regulator of systemic acquired resistance SNI1 isoform X1 [Eucalyptus grandis]|uniref:negative regulator of systemic acquired resistance SNI1 isoform X1 n=1 Tax=Eucalyptus grandis TaxID=71139 RepID=UPI00192EB0A9|nr:negative regulator of systemic acquired resistance SNI1 isoform X1 [Eucalyptus grandis]XP_039169984.1 negative regulator of systemic acquired resistance SNI1 isoform X1 [Eucalyptus grandis]XP_039169985.1 negative regulator of systemic acquired resistance SNI1 isoform X1 [Eucalyptus grandis]XP_039169986.1 negative regulator of systemic acquired resistance SNI1 isoform X1 [Eucalyptus grandis]
MARGGGGGGADGGGGVNRSVRARAGVEENTLAILDAFESSDTRYSHDDRIAFLEAVRGASVVAENGTPPTNKMLEAIFRILRTGESLQSIMASFQLLKELEKRYPRVCSSAGGTSESSSAAQPELEVLKEAWSPLSLGSDSSTSGRAAVNDNPCGPVDPSGFDLLIQGLFKLADGTNHQVVDIESLRNMLLLQYLINFLERDFSSRSNFYEETKDWTIIRESLLSMLLCSRKFSYKNLMKDCPSVLCGLRQLCTGFGNDLTLPEFSEAKSSKVCDTSLVIASLEVVDNTCMSMQKLMTMIMELDVLKNQADKQGCTTRADGFRTPLLEIILDELTYNYEILSPYLQVFNQPKWKLELILQYLSKYTAKQPSVRTRRSSDSTDDPTFGGVLKCLLNGSSLRSLMKKIGAETVQLLLAHAFEAHLALSCKSHSAEGALKSNGDVVDHSLMEICKHMISAFDGLKKVDEKMDILPVGKEALFVATTILSIKS